MQQALIQALNGLSLAGILILVALGLWFIFGVLGVINLAHGELFMLGAYSVVVVYGLTGSVWLGMLVAPIVIGALGINVQLTDSVIFGLRGQLSGCSGANLRDD